jgi:hypothetical protein
MDYIDDEQVTLTEEPYETKDYKFRVVKYVRVIEEGLTLFDDYESANRKCEELEAAKKGSHLV